MSAGVIALIIAVLVVIFVCLRRQLATKQTIDDEKSKRAVFGYLQQYSVDDVDLRKSPAGGWHGTYLNKLAYGVNRPDDDLEFDSIENDGAYYVRSENNTLIKNGGRKGLFHRTPEEFGTNVDEEFGLRKSNGEFS